MTVWFFDVGEITYLPVFTGQITRLMSRESCDIYCNKKKTKENHDCTVAAISDHVQGSLHD